MASDSHTLAVSGGPTTFTLNPDVDFAATDTCTLTVRGAQVTELDGSADAMVANASISFSTIELAATPPPAV